MMGSISSPCDKIEIHEIGRKIMEKYCTKRDGPIMMPPIPASKFIDKLPDAIQLAGNIQLGANAEEKKHQDSYEAEVKVYRCIEEMKRNYVVIHTLKHTHEQYSAFLQHECTKNPKEDEGESDFVVVGDQFVALLEVKGLSFQGTAKDSIAFEGCCNKGKKQRTLMGDLVKSIEPSMMVYEFTVFPNISKEEAEEQYLCDETILFSEDLDNLKHIVRSCETFASLPLTGTVVKSARDKLCCCLLGLWCIDQQNKWELDICSLSYCIIDISKKLRRALVTRKLIDEDKHNTCSKKKKGKEKKYPENPEMIVAPDLFKHHLNINCLTKHQLDVFDSTERFLWVEGPAGTGKTIVMLGKIIDLALNTPPEKRILLIMEGYTNTPIVIHHMILLNNIRDDIKCTLSKCDFGVAHLRYDKTCNSKIVILVNNECLTLSASIFLSSFDSIFVDDYQFIVDSIHTKSNNSRDNDIISKGLLPILKNSDKSDTFSVWIFCDEAQFVINNVAVLLPGRKMFIANMDNLKRYFVNSKLELSINLRNTYEISAVLSVIRRQYVEDFAGSANRSVNWPQQVGGHLLRGTKPVIYLLNDDGPASWEGILTKEMEKLRGPGSHLLNKDIAVPVHGAKDIPTVMSVTKKWNTKDDEIKVLCLGDCVSAEWPAIIFIIRFSTTIDSGFKFITLPDNNERETTLTFVNSFLYTIISRATVYSTVILYDYTRNICKNTDKLIDELKQRGDVCRIIEH